MSAKMIVLLELNIIQQLFSLVFVYKYSYLYKQPIIAQYP